MNSNFRDYCPDQAWMFPPTLGDFLSPEDPLHVFSEVVDCWDLSAFYAHYSAEGSPAYHPRMMAKLLVYAYSLGIRSSRRLAALTRFDVRFMYLTAMQQPDFRTISDFRHRHLVEFQQLLQQVVRLCQELGLVALDHFALDGTKMEANAGWKASRTPAHLEKENRELEERIATLMQEIEAVDQQEDAQFGPDRQGEELPSELIQAQARKLKIEAALEKLRQTGDSKGNTTDPEARVMQHYGGKRDWSYNGQIVVDSQDQIIVAAAVVADCTDQHQLAPMYERAVANVGQAPQEISADSGYCTRASQLYLQENGIQAYMPDQNLEADKAKPDHPFGRDEFNYSEKDDSFTCPRNKKLVLVSTRREGGVKTWEYRCRDCPQCPDQKRCTPKNQHRTLMVSQTDEFRDAMRAKLDSPEGRRQYLKRQATVEPVIGQMKRLRGFTHFLLRGLEKVNGEFQLMALAHNLRKISLKIPKLALGCGDFARN